MHKHVKRLFDYVGPWPIEPLYLASLTFFMVASLYSLGENNEAAFFSFNALLRPVFSGLIAIFAYIQLRVVTQLVPDYSKKLGRYLALLLIQSFSVWAWVVLFRNHFPTIRSSFTAFLSPVPLVRFSFTYICINAFIGLSRAKLAHALEEKEATLKLVESQRNLLLEYDETTRKKLSEFLHDRVQSSLVTACFELQAISREIDGESKAAILRVIDALEKLRSVDVRNASQTLSPAVGNADLQTSISVMTQDYAPHIRVSFDDRANVEKLQLESNPNLFLGIYRIIEQAFLNCAIHGQAENFYIEISADHDSLHLTTRNDGKALPDMRKSGLGSAIINSWVRTLDGRWQFGNTSQGLVELKATFPRNLK